MKTLKTILLGAILFTAFSGFSQTEKQAKIMKDAEKVKKEMIQTDKGLKNFVDNSTAYVIFPNVGEGALIVGGASGNGVVYQNGQPIGLADLKKIDVGLQAGGQALSEVIFFETEEALKRFKDNELTFSAEASAVIVESGASKNANYNEGVVVFTMPKAGAMADLSVGGQKLKFDAFDDRSK
ncbi:lipid-binding SYLF domain-containing protein [Cellulophaga baltica]|uniref:lipid-binding SYLF domain-containing protein n=1 Tax=Cellulophaga TaxID=104264 RepID=UPI001C07B8FB|nr:MULTISPECIES: lipid-binding SYLF domain-containing protein [Cellulophaga]MBU2997968.1 lipid-binding SYLF domain-containing protein [Cellulophaga baltica]MDO6769369.1 lipid-binding SYLF domain-containing protein [Cellulophaga sp. 1_MG-2023]